MFETVAPDAFAKRDRHVFYETLPASIGIHVLAIGAVVVVVMAEIHFPIQPPKVIVGYIASALASEPVPPPPPPPPAQHDPIPPQQQVKLETVLPVAMAPPEVAPEVIPD